MNATESSLIDVHSHVFPCITRRESRMLDDHGPWLRIDSEESGMMMSGDREYRPVRRVLWDPEARVADMDALGVSAQVVSSTPLLFGYGSDRVRASEWCEWINDELLAFCARAPGRLWPMCQVPLQDIELASRELRRAVKAGHVGVHLGNHVGDKEIDSDEICEFLTLCAELGVGVFVHPWDMLGSQRMAPYMLPWLVGMPAETQLSVLRLMLSGALERIPTSLQICFAHGGGSFSFLLGRAENAWRNHPLVRRASPKPPSGYLDRIAVDSAVFDQRAFRLLFDVMGPERILLGTDYPFPLGESAPGALLSSCEFLSDADHIKLTSKNARSFFSLPLGT